MEYAQQGDLGNNPWKYERNPFSGSGGDVKTSFFYFQLASLNYWMDFGGDSEKTNKNKNHRHSTAL